VFLGTRDDPEIFYPALDIVALTSLNEGTPLSLIEGMANARPVIATAVGGVVDLVGEKVAEFDGYTLCQRGIKVESREPNDFAKGLNRLIEDEGLRLELGARGHAYAVRNYAKERLVDDMARLYQVLAGPPAATS